MRNSEFGMRNERRAEPFRIPNSAFRIRPVLSAAFTLFEVLITIAVIGLIIAFSFADFGKVTASRSLVESSDRLRTLVLRAHAEAMRSGLKFRISFPGTPDPLDPTTKDKQVDVPAKTYQP